MSAGDAENPAGGQGYEIGRLVGEFAAANRSLGTISTRLDRIDGRLENVATKTDIEGVRLLAQAALDRANIANTRLDTQSAAAKPWVQIGVAVLIALILAGLGALAIKGAV